MADNQEACEICGQNDFLLKDGFYYCKECGTQTQNIYEEEAAEMDDVRYIRSSKIKTTIEKPELTSWECFNYLLRGLVEELMELGAKAELKLTALQIWTAYLHKTEVAFFDKKEPKLPKLGPRFSSRDMTLLYNQETRKRKSKSGSKSSKASGSGRGRWKSKMRKVMNAEYEHLSQGKASKSSQFSSSTATTTRAIRLQFSSSARKCLKKHMPKSHLAKHEVDSKSDMECHILRPIPTKKLERKFLVQRIGRKTVYTILYLALNLIEDDIQLCDMLRFMSEGHLSSMNISHFFPDNVAASCEKITKCNMFFSRRSVFRHSCIREHATELSKFIHIPELKTPNIYKLAERFMTDLRLPKEFAIFLKRLINFYPPKIKYKFVSEYTPCYEGRAMAYIIFLLKLLFGLDDIKEQAISTSAKNINEYLKELHCSEHKKLFVWNDWQNYIEMRKVIISQCHSPTSLAFKQSVNVSSYIEQLKFDQGVSEEDVLKGKRANLLNFERIFDQFQMNYKHEIKDNAKQGLKFPPSLTPYSFYMENIINNPPNYIHIPEYMKKDHSDLEIHAFLKPKHLKDFFKKHGIELDVSRIECNPKRDLIGIFRNWGYYEKRRMFGNGSVLRIPVFDINEEDWLDEISAKEKISKSSIKPNVAPVKLKKALLQIIAKHNGDNKEENNKPLNSSNVDEVETTLKETKKVNDNIETASLRSFDLFSELDMNPLNNTAFNKPRTNLENDDIFEDVSDDEVNEISDGEQEFDKKIKFLISNLDYWFLFGEMSWLTAVNFAEIKNNFPRNFLWVLETFSQIIGIDVEHLYHELLTIENYFINVLEPVEKIRNILIFKEVDDNLSVLKKIKYFESLW